MGLTKHEKEFLVATARAQFDLWYPKLHPRRSCVQLAHCMTVMLQRLGIKSHVVAGSASWYTGEQAKYDGDHFGYVFEADDAELRRRLLNTIQALPEIHAWNYVPGLGEIVDISAMYLVEQSRECAGTEWQTDVLPPPFYWDTPEAVAQRRAYYQPDKRATIFVHRILAMQGGAILVRR